MTSRDQTQATPQPARAPRAEGSRAGRADSLQRKAMFHLALGATACGVTILVGAVVLRAREAPRAPEAMQRMAPQATELSLRVEEDRREGNMTRDEAVRLARGYAEAQGVKNSPGLNDKNLGGVETGGQTLYIEYQPEARRVECGALIYRFKQPPKDKVLEGFRAEEAAGTDTGGGALYYEPRNQGLFLRRLYRTAVPEAQFNKEMDRLRKAAAYWSDQVLDRVATKVFG